MGDSATISREVEPRGAGYLSQRTHGESKQFPLRGPRGEARSTQWDGAAAAAAAAAAVAPCFFFLTSVTAHVSLPLFFIQFPNLWANKKEAQLQRAMAYVHSEWALRIRLVVPRAWFLALRSQPDRLGARRAACTAVTIGDDMGWSEEQHFLRVERVQKKEDVSPGDSGGEGGG